MRGVLLSNKETRTLSLEFVSYSETYLYLRYFFNIRKRSCPRLVLMSNDHSVENRCLINICNQLKIKTTFLQYGSGSGSTYLPPLSFDYSFLDGLVFLERYAICDRKQSESSDL